MKKTVIHRARPGSRKQMPAKNRNEDSGEMRLEWYPEFARTRPGEVCGGGGAGTSIPWLSGGGRNEGSDKLSEGLEVRKEAFLWKVRALTTFL